MSLVHRISVPDSTGEAIFFSKIGKGRFLLEIHRMNEEEGTYKILTADLNETGAVDLLQAIESTIGELRVLRLKKGEGP